MILFIQSDFSIENLCGLRGMNMDKLEFIDSYIKQCDEIIAANDYNGAKSLSTDIVSTFKNEIDNIKDELDNYSLSGFYSSRKTDFLGDLKLLKQKLENYYYTIRAENEKMQYELEMARLAQPILTASAEAKQTVNNNISISLPSVIDAIDGVPKEELSEGEKKEIKDLLYSLEGIKSTKDRNMFWEKAKGLLKYLLDKGIDVGIAILPYILNGLQ